MQNVVVGQEIEESEFAASMTTGAPQEVPL